jgi:hypothetical protein
VRLLLDEGFPSPPGFSPATVDASVEVIALRDFDHSLTDTRTPDWYLYLRANDTRFDALVTRDWRQSEQPEELWTLTRTQLSVITWRRPIEDPIREWGQLLAYLPEVRRMITENGPSVVFLPSPRLGKNNFEKASDQLGVLATTLAISNRELRDQARTAVIDGLDRRGETARFAGVVD